MDGDPMEVGTECGMACGTQVDALTEALGAFADVCSRTNSSEMCSSIRESLGWCSSSARCAQFAALIETRCPAGVATPNATSARTNTIIDIDETVSDTDEKGAHISLRLYHRGQGSLGIGDEHAIREAVVKEIHALNAAGKWREAVGSPEAAEALFERLFNEAQRAAPNGTMTRGATSLTHTISSPWVDNDNLSVSDIIVVVDDGDGQFEGTATVNGLNAGIRYKPYESEIRAQLTTILGAQHCRWRTDQAQQKLQYDLESAVAKILPSENDPSKRPSIRVTVSFECGIRSRG